MQPLTVAPRDGYTYDEVVAVIRDTPAPLVGAGAELIGMDLETVEDLTADLFGGSVGRDSYATLHGTCDLSLGRGLDWANAIVRPYVTMDGLRFDLGAYLTSVPSEQTGTDPMVYEVQGHDILLLLRNRVGTGYSLPAGTVVLDTVEAILLAQGFLRYVIDPEKYDAVLPAALVWPLDDNTTWLTVVNDLLAAVGYRGIWSDWRGALRCEPYISPTDRDAEWVYHGTGAASQLSVGKTVTRDLFDTPNRWIAVRRDNIDGPQPVEGDGMYTYTNEYIGPTSVEARRRVITAPLIQVDAVDQAALVAAVQDRAAADMSTPTVIELAVPVPNPAHWHFDRVFVDDPALGGFAEVLVTKWTLPLAPDTGDMTQTWSVLR